MGGHIQSRLPREPPVVDEVALRLRLPAEQALCGMASPGARACFSTSRNPCDHSQCPNPKNIKNPRNITFYHHETTPSHQNPASGASGGGRSRAATPSACGAGTLWRGFAGGLRMTLWPSKQPSFPKASTAETSRPHANPWAVGRVTPCAPLLTSQRTSFPQPPPFQCFNLKKHIMQVTVCKSVTLAAQAPKMPGCVTTGFPLPSTGRGIEGEGWSYPEPPPARASGGGRSRAATPSACGAGTLWRDFAEGLRMTLWPSKQRSFPKASTAETSRPHAYPWAVGRVTPCAPLLTSKRTSFPQPPPSQCFTFTKHIMQVTVCKSVTLAAQAPKMPATPLASLSPHLPLSAPSGVPAEH
jgi:hypothetical protein